MPVQMKNGQSRHSQQKIFIQKIICQAAKKKNIPQISAPFSEEKMSRCKCINHAEIQTEEHPERTLPTIVK